jgi:hypothetical protein
MIHDNPISNRFQLRVTENVDAAVWAPNTLGELSFRTLPDLQMLLDVERSS